ncbi:hypothetical protein SAMN02910369_00511 [Lachnospiraceae bacterium NE2001]|nr:hypothetical protein SAMN02910369_00511 [Lachnospiraceae bacterium NE2001]
MAGILNIKNVIRNFCRKQDEVITPLFRFVWSLIVFMSINKIFTYNTLASKTEVVILLAILAALLPDGFMFFMVGALVTLHSFSVSLEVGAVFIVIFTAIYCVYVRFFPKYVYAIMLVPICYVAHIPFAAPIIIAMVAGIPGLVPSLCGIVLYYFSLCAAEVARLLEVESAENEIEALKQLSEVLVSNKDMYTTMIIFAITILVTAILKKFSYPFAIYIAIAAGTIMNIIGSILAGYVVGEDVDATLVLVGSLIGAGIALIIRFGQGVLDYKHTERVQFEDDDYYYYVKAVPKIDSEKAKEKGVKKSSDRKKPSEAVTETVKDMIQNPTMDVPGDEEMA